MEISKKMTNSYDQEIYDCIEAIESTLDQKSLIAIDSALEQLKHYSRVRTQLIDNLAIELQNLGNRMSIVIDALEDDDDYFESESPRARKR